MPLSCTATLNQQQENLPGISTERREDGKDRQGPCPTSTLQFSVLLTTFCWLFIHVLHCTVIFILLSIYFIWVYFALSYVKYFKCPVVKRGYTSKRALPCFALLCFMHFSSKEVRQLHYEKLSECECSKHVNFFIQSRVTVETHQLHYYTVQLSMTWAYYWITS